MSKPAIVKASELAVSFLTVNVSLIVPTLKILGNPCVSLSIKLALFFSIVTSPAKVAFCEPVKLKAVIAFCNNSKVSVEWL